MPRLTISLPKTTYNKVSSIAMHSDESMSNIINRLIGLGMVSLDLGETDTKSSTSVDQHCQQLIIQMNALIKNLSAEMLNFKQDDFEHLRQAALAKYNELMVNKI